MKYTTFFCTAALAVVVAFPAMAQQTINFAFPGNPRAHLVGQIFVPWIEKVNREAGGAIKVVLKTGRTLASFDNVYDRVQADVAQMGWGVQHYMRGKFRRSTVVGLPFEATTAEAASLALWRLYEKGVTMVEYNEVIPLAIVGFPPASLHSNDKPIKSLNDIKGMKLAVSNRVQAGVLKRLGAAPISLRVPAMYQGLNRGTVSGILMVWTGFMPFKLFEVTKHHYDVPLGTGSGMVFMSKKVYERLPAAGRRAIDANSGEKFSHDFGKFWDRVGISGRKAVAKMPGHTFAKMSTGEIAKWRVDIKPVVEDWKKRTADGPRVLSAYRAEIAAIRGKK